MSAFGAHGVAGSFRRSVDGIYRCDEFQHLVWQEHGFGTVQAAPSTSVTLRQTHSTDVIRADGLHDRQAEGDGLLTDQAGLSIGIRTADCVPILLLDPKRRAVGAIHAGWKGTANGIISNAIERMREWFGSEPEHLLAAIGPCIRACCYEVGIEVAARFASQFPDWKAEEEGRRKLDLVLANVEQMQEAGMKATCIFDSELCTSCEREFFFSYRRDPTNPGRMVSAVCRLA